MNEKINAFLKLLYPECDIDNLDSKQLKDKEFIEKNLKEIIDSVQWIFEDEFEMGVKLTDPTTRLKRAMSLVKVDMYKKMLYPDNSKSTRDNKFIEKHIDEIEEEYITKGKNIKFIENHVDEIDEMYTTYVSQLAIKEEAINKQEIIRDIISELKTKQITPEEIAKATIKVSTTAKVEVEQVENGENTRDNVKEGEEVGDDN